MVNYCSDFEKQDVKIYLGANVLDESLLLQVGSKCTWALETKKLSASTCWCTPVEQPRTFWLGWTIGLA